MFMALRFYLIVEIKSTKDIDVLLYIFIDIGPFIYQEVTRADIDEFTESTTSILKCVDSELEMLHSLWIIYCINLKTFKDP